MTDRHRPESFPARLLWNFPRLFPTDSDRKRYLKGVPTESASFVLSGGRLGLPEPREKPPFSGKISTDDGDFSPTDRRDTAVVSRPRSPLLPPEHLPRTLRGHRRSARPASEKTRISGEIVHPRGYKAAHLGEREELYKVMCSLLTFADEFPSFFLLRGSKSPTCRLAVGRRTTAPPLGEKATAGRSPFENGPLRSSFSPSKASPPLLGSSPRSPRPPEQGEPGFAAGRGLFPPERRTFPRTVGRRAPVAPRRRRVTRLETQEGGRISG